MIRFKLLVDILLWAAVFIIPMGLAIWGLIYLKKNYRRFYAKIKSTRIGKGIQEVSSI